MKTDHRAARLPPALDTERLHQLWHDLLAMHWRLVDGRLQLGRAHPDRPEPHEEALGHWAEALLPHVDGNRGGPFQTLQTVEGPDGQLRHVLIVGFPNAAGAGAHPVGVVLDVTAQNQRIQELAQQSLTDSLTGLYNLNGFFLFAEHELKVARRRGTQSALLYVDVDGLKGINDSYGQEEGNGVLVSTAHVLRQTFRDSDLIARLGGDEFAVFASDVRGDPGVLVRRLAYALLDSGTAQRAVLSLSCGLATCEPGPQLSLSHLLATADQAMYQNKLEKRFGGQRSGGS